MILSWPGPGPFSILGGEPALTLIPNLMIAGILTAVLSLILLVWAILFVHTKHGGPVLILLSLALLPVGGGMAPPILGTIIGITAMRINAPLRRRPIPLLAGLWPWSLAIGLGAWLLMLPGLPILSLLFGLAHDPAVVSILALCMLLLFFTTSVTGLARDSRIGVA